MTAVHSGSDPVPAWRSVVDLSDRFEWVDGSVRLKSIERRTTSSASGKAPSALQRWLVRFIYADQNSSRTVSRGLAPVLARLDDASAWGVNLGAGDTTLHSRLLNLDIYDGPGVHFVCRGDDLPLRSAARACVLRQEVLEHVPDPDACVREVERVLAPGGLFYLQLPFIIGYHPGPNDYWRFTREGIRELLAKERWEIIDSDVVLEGASGFYRIAVEFVAVLVAAISRRLYRPAKAATAIALWPIKLLDPIMRRSPERDRIPGGYWVLARRRPTL